MGTAKKVNIQALYSAISSDDIMSSSGYYRVVERGISGKELKKVVQLAGECGVFARIIGKDKANLSRSYLVKRFPKLVGDNIVDATRTYILATRVYGTFELAQEWLNTQLPALGGNSPVDLMDTHAGRTVIRETLRKIEFGEYG